jgi:transcriptional regulator with XRE-family HTH domain
MAPLTRIRLQSGTLPAAVGSVIREARLLIGWSQGELAIRAATSQTKVWRLESAEPGAFDMATLDRVLAALGLRPTLELEGRHLADRDDQRDRVHAALSAALAGRLRRAAWSVESEVPTGARAPTGWIDLVANRDRDAAMLVIEIKADLPDIGGVQRQVDWYEREAPYIGRRLGWQPSRIIAAVVCLDTASIAHRLREHQALLATAFPGDAHAFAMWLTDPAVPFDGRRTLAVTDLAPHRGLALAPSHLQGRRRAPVYESYAAAAAVISRRRHPGGPPRSRPPSYRSRPP